MQLNITLTDTEASALSYNHVDFDFYINSIINGQIKIAEDEVINKTVQHCIDNGVQVPTTREEIVAYGFANGIVKSAAVRVEEAKAETAVITQSQEPV